MASTKTDPGPFEALLQQILVLVTSQLPILNLIFQKPVAVENTPYEISNAVKGIQALAEDGTVGFAALEALMVASFNTLATDIGQTALKSVKPTWWDTAPSWWVDPTTNPTLPSATDNADAVWRYLDANSANKSFGEELSEASAALWNRSLAEQAFTGRSLGPWTCVTQPFQQRPPDPNSNVDNLDFSTILVTDTSPTNWLNRVGSFGDYFPMGGGAPGRFGSDDNTYWLPWLTQPEFDEIKRGLFPSATSGAPVWPGIAGVTLGAPVALSPTCVVTGPMHGVIIDITSAAPRQIYQVFGGMQGYRFVGGLQFVDDRGEAERIQSIGMQHEVILCKSMVEAASCSIRTDSAVTGTATPFVIT